MADLSAAAGQVDDAETSGLDEEAGATCRGCGKSYDAGTEIFEAVRAAYDRYIGGEAT